MKSASLVLVLLLCLALVSGTLAAVKPNPLFTDNAVLQQGISVPVWGTADNGEKVTVKFQNQEVSTRAVDGKWMIRLEPLTVGGPYTMKITGTNSIEINNVLVGEVWICSGQSNMELHLAWAENPKANMENSNDPQLRFFTVPKITTPAKELNTSWKVCRNTTSGDFSAVGYFFAKHLRKVLGVPVGMLSTSWGGTPVEAWMPKSALESDPAFKEIYTYGYRDQNTPSILYNAMIAPLVPYAFKGAIWYQGESNAGHAYLYRKLFPTMIKSWREAWGEGDFPFICVQLAPFTNIKKEPGESDWAELREAQLLTSLHTHNVGMAVITDYGDEKDIHPKPKEPVGERLAIAAQGMAYNMPIEYSGPIYKSMKVSGDKIVLTFKHIAGGLVAKGGELKGFAIAGEDRKFVNAQAEIKGSKVIVWSPSISKPVAVRFGWANYPVVNLYNKDGLPASPFRTDSFPGLTQPK